LRIGLLSFHFQNRTAEGLATAKLARALTDGGHAVTVFTSLDNPLNGSPVLKGKGPLSGITIYRVAPDLGLVPRWWTVLAKRANRNVVWDKIGAVPNLVYGCQIQEWAWALNVTRQIMSVWKSGRHFDILHTRLNHPISHLAGLELTRQLRQLPWCAYFSDPWPYHLYPEPYKFTVGPATRYRSEQILKQILTRAGSYVFPSIRLRDHLLNGKRAGFVKNAFVAPHLATVEGNIGHPESNGMLRLRHSGFLMRERNIGPLLEGVRCLLAQRPQSIGRICIEFAGRYQGNNLPSAPVDLQRLVKFHSYMKHDAIWDWLQNADVFLLVEAKMKEGIFLPSKLADYLRGGRPILALSPTRGSVADCLRGGGGIVVEPDDVGGISLALIRLYDAWEAGSLMEIAPTESQVQSVSPAEIVPIYEQAFQKAMDVGAESAL
jgi:glycosyltransferase involved in cell wall biosynthesis